MAVDWAICLGLLWSLVASRCWGFGVLLKPQPRYFDESMKSGYRVRINASILGERFAGRRWDLDPSTNARNFAEVFDQRKTSLRALVEAFVPSCGNSRIDGPPTDVQGMTAIEWGDEQRGQAFAASEQGPCEVWIDMNRVFANTNCAKAFPSSIACMPVNFAVCTLPTCVLQFYWLPLHEQQWPVFKHCVLIAGISTASLGSLANEEASASSDSGSSSQSSSGTNYLETEAKYLETQINCTEKLCRNGSTVGGNNAPSQILDGTDQAASSDAASHAVEINSTHSGGNDENCASSGSFDARCHIASNDDFSSEIDGSNQSPSHYANGNDKTDDDPSLEDIQSPRISTFEDVQSIPTQLRHEVTGVVHAALFAYENTKTYKRNIDFSMTVAAAASDNEAGATVS